VNFDKSLFLFINHLPHNVLFDGIFLSLSAIGSLGAIWVILGLTFFFLEKKKDYHFFLTLFFSLVATFFLVDGFLKPLFARPRPDMAIMDSFSFPSGHAAAAFAAASILSFKKKKWRPFFYLLAILISFSRIYLGEHYPLDVVGGGIVGYVISGIFLRKCKNQSAKIKAYLKTQK